MITLKETTERYNLGQNKMIQNADQNHGPTGITCTNSHRPVSMSFDQVKLNKITNW